ncbi:MULTISPECIES: hypothetical protein [Saccharothrix]|uniref:hypothetical protein n=1 Tax=Saccharothrix TaxID=2071 RepID=UPI0009397EF2|nr:hypothetical protein [Saccharothrix sp. CB00851]OKI31997.1 hypothetical protein A6A25_26500 [Saccharothrix sp. CB00851]
MSDPRDRPPLRLAELLRDRDVDWVLSGSTVLTLYGADLRPNDLDVVPDLAPDNLDRLAGLLAELGAVPAFFPDWEPGLTLEQCRAWTPRPATPANLDHLFVTRLGMLDVPPEITGTYTRLRAGATEFELAGVPVWVCDPREVLDRIPDPPRRKDHERAAAYAAVRARLGSAGGG